MVNSVIGERVREVMADTFGVDPLEVSSASSAQTLAAWTSLAHLRLMANLEQAFGLRFTMDEMTVMTSVQAVETVLAARGVDA